MILVSMYVESTKSNIVVSIHVDHESIVIVNCLTESRSKPFDLTGDLWETYALGLIYYTR